VLFSEEWEIILFNKKYPLYTTKYTQYSETKSIHDAPFGLPSIILDSGNCISIPNRNIVSNSPTIGENKDLKGCFLFMRISPY